MDGPRPAGAIASVLSYACSRETDKRALAREALDRYRELNLIYELADEIGATLEVDEVARVAVGEASRLPTGGTGFLLVHEAGEFAARPADGEAAFPGADPSAGILGAIFVGDGEIVNDVAADPRATEAERRIASLVAAPLQVRGERIGVIGTMSTTPLEFRASDLKVLGAIASLAAPTLDQAAVHRIGGHARPLIAIVLGVLGSIAVLVYLVAGGPGSDSVAIVLAALLPASLVLYGGAARRRASELRDQQAL